jgi:hypothetical protein
MGDDLQLRLRPFTEADLDFLDRLDTDPDALGPFEWFGFRDPRTRRRRWEKDGFLGAESSALAIELAGGEVLQFLRKGASRNERSDVPPPEEHRHA